MGEGGRRTGPQANLLAIVHTLRTADLHGEALPHITTVNDFSLTGANDERTPPARGK